VSLTAVTDHSLEFSFSPATDNVRVVRYLLEEAGMVRSVVDSVANHITLDGLAAGSTHTVVLRAQDAAGNTSPPSGSVTGTTADNQDPSIPTGLHVVAQTESAVTLAWDASTDDVGVTGYLVESDGLQPMSVVGTTATLTGLDLQGRRTFSVRALDLAGNASLPSAPVEVTGGPSLPPAPSTIAPRLDPSVALDLAAATEFLYRAPNPIQTGVDVSTMVPHQAAVLRGRVLDAAGQPLSGVAISIQGHPKFGQTLSRSNGMFDLAVNGGAPLTVNYAKSGMLPAQRQTDVPWRDYVVLDDVTLVQLDALVTTVVAGSSLVQVAQGSFSHDVDGTRRATLLFLPETTATLQHTDGTTEELTTLDVRATEYTVGERGLSTMPGPLPHSSAYTYAVELSVDEAGGNGTVSFNQPVAVYVENFIGFPVGGAVPSGYFDRNRDCFGGRGCWIPSEDGSSS